MLRAEEGDEVDVWMFVGEISEVWGRFLAEHDRVLMDDQADPLTRE